MRKSGPFRLTFLRKPMYSHAAFLTVSCVHWKGSVMRAVCRALFVLALLLLAPVAAHAQASITGVVKDASGAVLPGVTVEVASPVLIEKVRTGVTDGTGQYRIL